MLKRLPGKNQRSKGVKVKHVLQIFLLLGVCFWLVYQVKHSHDKKKEFDENKVSVRKQSDADNETLRLGRKDLPREDATENEKPEEEEEEVPVEEEEKREEDREERENTREEEGEDRVEEEEENKNVESEDGGGGDDEIDENGQEKKDEDFVEGDREQEEEGDEERQVNENGDVEDQIENENSTEDQDNDGGDRSDHEAREEHYKADDASSEVAHEEEAHDTTEMKVNSENSDENLEKISLNSTENVNQNENVLESVVKEGAGAENSNLNLVSHVKKVDNSSSSSVDDQNSETKQSDRHSITDNNHVEEGTESKNNSTTEVSTEASNNSTVEVSTEGSDNPVETGKETMDLSQKNNHEESVSDSGNAQNMTTGDNVKEQALSVEQTNNSDTVNSENKADHSSTVSTETEYVDESSKDSVDSANNGGSNQKVLRPDETVQAGKEGASSSREENSDAIQGEKSEESLESTNGTEDTMQHDPIDSTDTQVGQELNEARTDLDTLPDLRSHGDENEEASAE